MIQIDFSFFLFLFLDKNRKKETSIWIIVNSNFYLSPFLLLNMGFVYGKTWYLVYLISLYWCCSRINIAFDQSRCYDVIAW